MKSAVRFSLVTVMAVALAGCATSRPDPVWPSEAEKAAANIGPLPENYQQLVKDHMQTVLKDPESARYRFPTPPKRHGTPKFKPTDSHKYYWQVSYFVNAKNSYGGYTGEDNYLAEIVNGRVVEVYNSSKSMRELDRFLNKR